MITYIYIPYLIIYENKIWKIIDKSQCKDFTKWFPGNSEPYSNAECKIYLCKMMDAFFHSSSTRSGCQEKNLNVFKITSSHFWLASLYTYVTPVFPICPLQILWDKKIYPWMFTKQRLQQYIWKALAWDIYPCLM